MSNTKNAKTATQQTSENKKASICESASVLKQDLDIALQQAGKTADQVKKFHERNVGTNGEILGATYTLTGEIEVVSQDINGVKSVYFALPTIEGNKLSLQQLMSISSLRGYTLDEPLTQQFYNKVDNADTPIIEEKEFVSEIMKGYYDKEKQKHDVEKLEKELPSFPTRNLVDLACYIADNPNAYKGTIVKYLGKATRQYTAKQDNPDTIEVDKWKQGYKRVMVSPLWNWQIAKKEA